MNASVRVPDPAPETQPDGWSIPRRVAFYGIPIALLIVIYWPGLSGWFMMDDFAWLGLPLEIHRWTDVFGSLFRPEAQGTVRVLSDRAFFLVLTSVFGINVVPFKICMAITAAANVVLVSTIARHLTKSALAAFAAAVFYVFNSALAVPMSWASAYNELLWPFFLLSSFYLFLRYTETGESKYYLWQWVTFLLGFGALELNVLYPALAALYAWLFARPYFRKTLPLFIPSVLFTIAHFAFVPNTGGDIYRMYFDRALPVTFLKYFGWTFGPCRLGGLIDTHLRIWGNLATIAIAAAVLCFAVLRLRKHDWLPAFLLAWWVILIAPLVPLKNHIIEYYPAVPMIGVCILGGWAFRSALRAGKPAAILAGVLALLYCGGNLMQARSIADWRHDGSRHFEAYLDGLRAANQASPHDAIILTGVEESLYVFGFADEPYRLYGLPKIYLAPGTEADLRYLRNESLYRTTPGDVAAMLQANAALVLDASDDHVQDVTASYAAKIRAENPNAAFHRVDVGQTWASAQLGPTWYPMSDGFRWMPDSATVRLSKPEHEAERLYITGYCPAAVVKNGPVHMTVLVGDHQIGKVTMAKTNDPFAYDFALPPGLADSGDMVVTIRLDRVLSIPGDDRRLGMVFGTFEVR